MKKKLKKDLKFLRTWKWRLPTAIAIAVFLFTVTVLSTYMRGSQQVACFAFYGVVSYMGLYFFNAWLVGDEEDNESSNVDN